MPALPSAFLVRPIAHRALHDAASGRPENSRAALQAAVAGGYGIEIDLQQSADGQAMVFHDDDLARLTAEAGPVRQRSAADLGAIPLRHATDGIPTLSEVLKIVAGRVPLLIEIKDQTGVLGPVDGALERATAEALKGYHGPVAVMSFNPHSMADMARRAPDIPRGLTTCALAPEHWPTVPEATRAALREIPDARRVGASFISHRWTDLAAPRVADLRAAGLAILCWTIRTPEQEAQARRIAQNVTFEGYAA